VHELLSKARLVNGPNLSGDMLCRKLLCCSCQLHWVVVTKICEDKQVASTRLIFAYVTAKFALPLYAHRCSPKKFTQPQLFACLVLKEFLKVGLSQAGALLVDTPDLCKAIELDKFRTSRRFKRRLDACSWRCRRVACWIRPSTSDWRWRGTKRRVASALDGTGFESHHASAITCDDAKAAGNTEENWHTLTYRRFPKVGILCDCASHMILAVVPGRGPAPDGPHFPRRAGPGRRRVRIVTLAADAGYDSERSHEYARQDCGVRTLIPPLIGRPTEKPPRGYWRRQMKVSFAYDALHARWQVETVNV